MLLRSLARIGRNQARNALNLLRGRPVTYPPLGSVTLDRDDVRLARQWLKDRSRWDDTEEVRRYEEEFAAWNGSEYAFAFMGGRVALSACIHALGLKPGDEVIIPGYTCVVVPNSFAYAGVKVVYSDIELETYGLDASILEKKITFRTKAIMLHHLYGLVCRDYEQILQTAKDNGLWIIEDCAHATGAEYKGRKVGNYGHVAFYSSEQSKVFTTIQGGMAVTNDQHLAAGLQEYADQAPVPDAGRIEKQLYNVILNYYQFKHPQRWILGDLAALLYGKYRLISTSKQEECGIQPDIYGMKMPSAIAAIGRNQLKKLDTYNQRRRESARRWGKWALNNGYTTPLVLKDSRPMFLRYPVLVEPEKKRDLSWAKNELRLAPGVWFVSNVHPADWEVWDCPKADRAVNECINFPGIVI